MDTLKRLLGVPAGLGSQFLQGAADLPRNIYGLGRAGLDAIGGKDIGPRELQVPHGSPLEGITNYFRGEPLGSSTRHPGGQELKENVINPLAESTIGAENLEPGSFLERQAQKGAYALPGFLATRGKGSLAPTAFASSMVGGAVDEALEHEGFTPSQRMIATYLAERNFGKVLNFMTQVPPAKRTKLQDMAKKEKKQYYNKAKDVGKTMPPDDAFGLQYALLELEEEALSDPKLTKAQREEVLERIKLYQQKIKNGQIRPDETINLRTAVNDNIETAKTPIEKQYYERLKNPIEEQLNVGRKNKAFAEPLKIADEFHAAENWNQDFPKQKKTWGQALTTPLATMSAFLFGGGLSSGLDPLTTGLAGLAGAAIGTGVPAGWNALLPIGREVSAFTSTPAVRKILAKATSEYLAGHIPEALSAYSKVNKMSEQFHKEYSKDVKQQEMKEEKNMKEIKKANKGWTAS